jgi:hypothetical protein
MTRKLTSGHGSAACLAIAKQLPWPGREIPLPLHKRTINIIKETIMNDTNGIKEYSPTEAGLTDIKSRMEGVIYDVTNVLGMAQAKRDRKELVTLRTTLEAKRVELKAPALERSRLIDAEASRIKGEISAIEQPIHLQIKAEENRVAALKKDKRLAAQQRDFAIMESITKLKTMIDRVGTFHAAKLDECLDSIEGMELTEEKFLTFLPLAIEARDQTLKDITAIRDAKVTAEAEAERVETERLAGLETERLKKVKDDKELAAGQEALRKQQEAFDEQKKETDRINGIKAMIESYYGPVLLGYASNMNASEIGELIEQLHNVCTEEFFAEFTREADCKREDLIRSLTDILAAAKDREAADEQLKKDREKVADDKRIADEKETKRLQEEADESEKKRLAAEKLKRKAERAKKLADAKCKDASTAFKQILDFCQLGQTKPAEAIEQIQIIAEANA